MTWTPIYLAPSDLGGFIEMISADAFKLMRGSEVTTYYRCLGNG